MLPVDWQAGQRTRKNRFRGAMAAGANRSGMCWAGSGSKRLLDARRPQAPGHRSPAWRGPRRGLGLPIGFHLAAVEADGRIVPEPG
jgi:hypothetical protein